MRINIYIGMASFWFAILTACSASPRINENTLSIPHLNFILNENVLISLTLLKGGAWGKNFKTAVDFQNFAWKINQSKYRKLKLFLADDLEKVNSKKFHVEFDSFFNQLKESDEYKKLWQETDNYKNDCIKEWNKNLIISSELMKKITKLNFNFQKTVDIYINHPAVHNGFLWDRKNQKIVWGSWGDFPNYTTVYLWHEILHIFIANGDLPHAVIQMATDNELRSRLNNTSLLPLVGHDWLQPLMEKIYLKWNDYLNSEMNLIDFIYEMKNTK